MAGFLDRLSNNTLFNTIQTRIREVANLGVRYDDMVVRNSQAVGATEGAFLKQGFMGDDEMMYSIAMGDIGAKKYIAFFDKDYQSRRDFLRKFSLNGEIQWCLDTIADEAIVQDERQLFCYAMPLNLELKEDVLDAYENNFSRLYTYWHFNDDTTAWQLFYQFLVDGFLSFEIIYNDEGNKIIGFKELDPVTLRQAVEKQPDGTFKVVWYQYENIPQMKRKLYDSQVIYISYAKGNAVSRVSYVERLIRSFNLLRIMEHTRVIWAVMNASFRMKMVLPIGSKSPQKAKESLAEMMSIYKEDVRLDYDSGELFVNGRPNIQFFKNYLFPSKNGETPDVSIIGGEGPDLSNMDALNYFYNKLKIDSKIPFSRFDRGSGGAVFNVGSDGTDREEIRFGKFINRLRSIFQEVITKPLHIQMVLDFPELADDELFKSQVGVRFNKDNVFERMKEMSLLQSSSEFITGVLDLKITMPDGQERSYFHPRYLIERYMFLSRSDIEANERFWTEDAEAAKAVEAPADGAPAGEVAPEGTDAQPENTEEERPAKGNPFKL